MLDEYQYAGAKDYIKEYRNRGFSGAFDGIMGNPRHACEKLRKALDILPKGPRDPGIDENIVHLLKSQLKNAMEQAKSELDRLRGYLDIVGRERVRCEENLQVLNRDRNDIQGERTQGYYSEITQRQADQYQTVLSQQQIILELIAAMEALLREAMQRIQESETDRHHTNDTQPENRTKHHDTNHPTKKDSRHETAPEEDEPYRPPEL